MYYYFKTDVVIIIVIIIGIGLKISELGFSEEFQSSIEINSIPMLGTV